MEKSHSTLLACFRTADPHRLYYWLCLAVYLGCRAIVLQVHHRQNVQFVGLSNYAMIWSDNTFTHAFWFTAAFTVVSTLLINVLAFGHRAASHRGMHGTNAFRTIFFLPNLIGGIVLGLYLADPAQRSAVLLG